MSGITGVKKGMAVCAEIGAISDIQLAQGPLIVFLLSIILSGSILSNIAIAAVNVNISSAAPSGMQNDVIATVTTYYNASVIPTPFFPNNRNVTIFSKKAIVVPPVDPGLITLNTITNKLVAISSDTFVYGFADGLDYQRVIDLWRLGVYQVNCSSPTFFHPSITEPPWNPSTCSAALGFAWEDIYNLKYSTPIVIPPVLTGGGN